MDKATQWYSIQKYTEKMVIAGYNEDILNGEKKKMVMLYITLQVLWWNFIYSIHVFAKYMIFFSSGQILHLAR